MRFAYPLCLDLTERVVVIVGGGAVAARKASGVIAAGAKGVRIVAPELTVEMPQPAQIINERYDPRHLNGADLVFAATDDPQVNSAIVRDARARNVLVNRADADEDAPGDFTVPAVLRQGALTIAVSAGGAPALAARIRDEIEHMLDARWQKLADAMQTLRPIIMDSIRDPHRRRDALHDLATEDAARAALEGEHALRHWLRSRYPELPAD